jgi:FixJ family two-component response regulator
MSYLGRMTTAERRAYSAIVTLTPTTIAVVDDDENVRSALQELLRAAKFEALAFASAEALLDSPAGARIDCLIADVNLPGMSGVALVHALEGAGRALPTVLISALDDKYPIGLKGRAGTIPRLRKPFSDDELFTAVAQVLLR